MNIDSDRVSEKVRQAIRDTWAILAAEASKQALVRVRCHNDLDGAERLMCAAEQWLIRAHARATDGWYRRPS
jgi:hypothetical protein